MRLLPFLQMLLFLITDDNLIVRYYDIFFGPYHPALGSSSTGYIHCSGLWHCISLALYPHLLEGQMFFSWLYSET